MHASFDTLKFDWILSRADEEVLAKLALEIMQAVPAIRVLKPPQQGLLMMRVQETVENEPFNLGEILVTECTVLLEEEGLGWGCCLGANEQRALYLAVLDLAWHCLPEWAQRIGAALAEEEKRVAQEEKILAAGVETTRVRFEVK